MEPLVRTLAASPPPATPMLAHAPCRAPRLSVVVVNYHQWRDTAGLVGQLQTSPCLADGAAEVVVVDNHSGRHPLAARVRRTPGVSLRRWRRNRGFARAVNEGCRLSRGEWLLLLNPDVTLDPGFADAALALAERRASEQPQLGVVGFRLRDPDGAAQPSTGPFPTLLGTLSRLLLPRRRRKYDNGPAWAPRPVDWATGCCLLIRRDCWEQLDGLDPDYFLYYEDVDFCRRVRERGWEVAYEPTPSAIHHHPLHGRAVPPHLRLVTRHALLTYGFKHWPAWQARLLAGVVVVEAAARQALARWKGRDREAKVFCEMGRLAADLGCGRPRAAWRRLQRVVQRQEERRACALSVVIPSHNRADLLRLCLASVQRYAPAGAEVLVIDDASPDGAVSATARAFAGIRVLQLEKQSGFCVAANVGLQTATNPIVELLNDDTEVEPGWADAALKWFADPTVAAVAPLVLRRSDDGSPCIDSAGDRYYLGGIAGKRGHGSGVAAEYLQARPVFGASASSAFIAATRY